MKLHKLVLSLIFLICLANSDLLFEQITKTSGIMGMGSSETQSKVFIKSDRQKTETISKILTTSSGSQISQTAINIIRLDKKIMWNLFPDQKTYMELEFGKIKAMTQGLKTENINKEKTQVKPVVDIKLTGERKTINGFDCEHIILTMKVNVKDHQTGETGEGLFKNDMWIVDFPQVKNEMEKFNKKFTAMLGTEETGKKMLSTMLGINENEYAEFENKIKTVKGMPIVSTMSMEVKAVGSKATNNVIFSVTNEVKSISTKPIANQEFEIPKGYKQQAGTELN